MITTPTTLVLGAGASMPYGFPSGKRLRDIIIENTFPSSNQNWAKELDQGYGYLKRFGKELKYSGKASVDAFLEYRPEYHNIGKSLMAYVLIPHEAEQNLYKTFDDSHSWYEYLLYKMHSSFESFGNNQVSIITFNYDRSIEQFIYNYLKYSFDKTPQECIDRIKQIPIIHVHGKLGNYHWEGFPFREYNPSLENKAIDYAMVNLKIVSETSYKTPEFREAYKLLQKAERIYFLGFAYHPANMERLGLDDFSNKLLAGTSFGLGNAECDEINIKWNIDLPNSGYKIDDFLRNYAKLN